MLKSTALLPACHWLLHLPFVRLKFAAGFILQAKAFYAKTLVAFVD
jgi:hypothetical protein